MMRFIVAIALVAASLVSAEDHLIMVGGNGTLTFSPSNITAVAGDTVTFQFMAKNHTATQSTFVTPCNQMQNTTANPPIIGISSGFLPVANGSTTFPQWKIGINDATTPLWFFCAQANHCQQGMVFSVNANANKTFDAYLAAAKAAGPTTLAPETNGSQTPPSSTGGVSSGGSSTGSSSGSSSSGSVDSGGVVSPSSPNGTGSGTSAAPSASKTSSAGRGAAAPYALSLLALVLGVAL